MLDVITQDENLFNCEIKQNETIVDIQNLLASEDGYLIETEDGSLIDLNKSYI